MSTSLIYDLLRQYGLATMIMEASDNVASDAYEGWFEDRFSMISCAKVLLSYYSEMNYYSHVMTPLGVFTQHFIDKPRISFIPKNVDQLRKTSHTNLIKEIRKRSCVPFRVWGLTEKGLMNIDYWRKGIYTATKHTEALLNVKDLIQMNSSKYKNLRYSVKRFEKCQNFAMRSLADISRLEINYLIDKWKEIKSEQTTNYKAYGINKRVPLAVGMYKECINAGGIGYGIYYEGRIVGLVQGFIDIFNRAYLTTNIYYSEDKAVDKYEIGIIMPVYFAILCRSENVKVINFGDYSKMNNHVKAAKDKLRPQIIPVYTLETSKQWKIDT